MRILYVGDDRGTSKQRRRALERLGHEVVCVDLWRPLYRSRWWGALNWRTGYSLHGRLVHSYLTTRARSVSPDLVWVNQGEFLGPKSVRAISAMGIPIVNFANDNPFALASQRRFERYRAAIPEYDLVAVVFAEAAEHALALGARRVVRKFISADEVDHVGAGATGLAASDSTEEVVFVGSWIGEHRSALVARLLQLGLPLSLWGDGWQNSSDWSLIRQAWRGPGIYDPVEYARRLRSAKICLGLLNDESGNLHTDRSIQIPALGMLLSAPRTSEHLELYEDGEEALFWSSPEECVARCSEVLGDPLELDRIRSNGRRRCLANGLFNEQVLQSILDEVVV